MSLRYVILALFLLTVAIDARRRKCRPHAPYTLNSLALSWAGDFCSNADRCTRGYNKWDGFIFSYTATLSEFMDSGLPTTRKTSAVCSWARNLIHTANTTSATMKI